MQSIYSISEALQNTTFTEMSSTEYIFTLPAYPAFSLHNEKDLFKFLRSKNATRNRKGEWSINYGEFHNHLKDIAEGRRIVDINKSCSYYPTPEITCEYMASKAADLYGSSDETIFILEPSAGDGRLAQAMQNELKGNDLKNHFVMMAEFNYKNQTVLRNHVCGPKAALCWGDFEDAPITMKFDIVIANPPYGKNIESTHLRKMMDMVKPGGVLCALLPPGILYKANTNINKSIRLDLFGSNKDGSLKDVRISNGEEYQGGSDHWPHVEAITFTDEAQPFKGIVNTFILLAQRKE